MLKAKLREWSEEKEMKRKMLESGDSGPIVEMCEEEKQVRKTARESKLEYGGARASSTTLVSCQDAPNVQRVFPLNSPRTLGNMVHTPSLLSHGIPEDGTLHECPHRCQI